MSNFVSFIGGTIFGTYIAQNYDTPNINVWSIVVLEQIRKLESEKRK